MKESLRKQNNPKSSAKMSGRREMFGSTAPKNNHNFNRNSNNRNNSNGHRFYANGLAENHSRNERHDPENDMNFEETPPPPSMSNGINRYPKQYRSSSLSLPNQYQNDLQNFQTLIRPFQNVSEKKSWFKHFKELTRFFQTSKSLLNSAVRERIFDETIRAFEKIFANKLYKNTVEELVLCMAAFCDCLQNLQSDLFTWILKIYFIPSTSEENKMIVLRCLTSIIETSTIVNVDNYFHIQIKLKKALESTNNAEMFLQIAQLMLLAGKRCPSSFQSHVENFIDILLGWYMDGHQPKMTLYLIENILMALDFKHHIEFSHVLLSQFLEDFGKYYLDLLNHPDNINNNIDSNRSNVDASKMFNLNLHRMALRVRVFELFYRKIYLENSKTILKMIDLKNGHTFCLNSIQAIMKAVIDLNFHKQMAGYLDLLTECNQSIIVLVQTTSTLLYPKIDFKLMETQFLEYCDLLLDIINNTSSLPQKSIVTSMDFIEMVIKNLDNQLATSFVDKLFDQKFQKHLKISLNKHIQQSYINLFYSLLQIKSPEILARSYKHILKSMKTSFDYLESLKSESQNVETGKIMKNLDLSPLANGDENEQKCLISLYIDVIMLAEIANTKHSLFERLVLSPNFMELMLYHLDLSNEWLAEHYPSIHYSLLYLFCTYCNKHHNFIAQSSVFVVNQQNNSNHSLISPLFDLSIEERKPEINNSGKDGGSSSSSSSSSSHSSSLRFTTPHSQASNYFVDILKYMKAILMINKLKINAILLSLELIDDILQYFIMASSNTKFTIIVNLDEFVQLINIVSEYSFSNNQDVCERSCKIFKNLLGLLEEPELYIYAQALFNYRKACDFNIAHTDMEIVKTFLDLLPYLPNCLKAGQVERSINQAYNIQNEIFLYPEETHLTIVSLMNKQQSEQFSPFTFQSIVDYIQKGNDSLRWIFRVFYSAIDTDRLKIPSTIRATISYLPFISNNFDSMKTFRSNYWTLIFWICYEFVQYCVENRLKTPLGKPQETFTRIESMIKMFVNNVSANSRVKTENKDDGGGDIQQNTIRIQMLLLIFDNFDKLIYNAVCGNSLRLYDSSKASRTFFKKNKSTCSEWVNRNRRSIMVLAMKVSQPTMVIHHGQELLKNYMADKSLFTLDEIEFILLLMIDSLIQLKAPETIMGYYIWAKENLNVKFVWMKPATDEANSRYEKAMQQYRALLQAKIDSDGGDSNQTTLNLITSNKSFICNDYTVDFFRKRILNCLLNLENYHQAVEWSDSNSTNSSTMKLFSTSVDYSYLKRLSTFTDLPMEKPLSKHQHNVRSVRAMSLDSESIYHQLQSNLFESTTKFYFADSIAEFEQELNDLVDRKLNPYISSFSVCGLKVENHFAALQKIAYQLLNMSPKNNKKLISAKTSLCHIDTNLDLDLLINSLSWQKVFCKLNTKINFIEQTSMKTALDNLLLKTTSKVRKNFNLDLAQDLLFQYAKSTIDPQLNKPSSLVDKATLLNIFQDSLERPFSQDLLNFCFETSKILHSSNDSEMAIEVLLKSINVFLDRSPDKVGSSESTSKMFLKLIQFIQTESHKCGTNEFEKLGSHPKFCLIDEKVACIKNLSHVDNITGKLLLLAVNNCPSLAKAWYQLADWSYRWGRKLVDIADDAEKANDDGGGGGVVVSTTTPSKEDNVIEFYKLAANSYMKFLHISTHTGCDDVDATLRLLRLILKHAPELREILESGLRETPTKPWKNITLQLFSRLNHHELYVRQSISELLCRIGSDSPHLVIFPAVTGSLDDQIKSKNYDYTSTKNDEDEEDDENGQSIDQNLVRNCYASLLDTLSHRDSKLVEQTKLFVHELRRITVLWDELWIGMLQHNLNEVKKQVFALEKEIEKTKNNVNLYESEKILFIKEQHNIFFRRILYSLKLTNMLTSNAPETPHEEWFQKNFNQLISILIDSIENPENINEPSNILYNYQNLFQTLRKRSLSTNNYRFQMQDISPKLANLANTVIPLPGLNGCNVTLKGVFKTVSVLHTYTKPKKIIFIGSDGRNYAYLFKGHEDLHLDERIMQFLSIVNKMIDKYGPVCSLNDKLFLRARHYSVTPLGNKSGLIQWVEGGQALYNLYKRWLSNRDVSLEEVNKKITANEVFKSKLIEHGIKSENRNDWTFDQLKKVYLELLSETPDDLIRKELWCSSINSYDHWNLMQNFTTSIAIMSMIGYILGLGDRHLDNILLDLTTGEVIHIDYNICFEKGKTLRVPEMVLCRLTPNIINAFGITGVEGKFRISCENILKILRRGKETLLTLLEAFVYDPLIDWTPEHEEGFTGAIYGGAKIAQLASEGRIIPKKQMEKENQDAIERLKQLMKSVEKRNADWPMIDTNSEPKELEIAAPKTASAFASIIQQDKTSKSNVDANFPKRNKRNAYAFSVWKRIKMKLDGLDPDPGKKSTISEQVNHVIKESVNVDNLARMFEGWTSWV